MLLGGEEEEDDAGGPDLDTVAGVETGGLLAYAVDESAVAAALIFDEEAFGVFANDGVLTRDLRVGQAEMAVGLTANGEGKWFDRDGARLISILNYEVCRMFRALHKCSHRPNGQIVTQLIQNFKKESMKSNILWRKPSCRLTRMIWVSSVMAFGASPNRMLQQYLRVGGRRDERGGFCV